MNMLVTHSPSFYSMLIAVLYPPPPPLISCWELTLHHFIVCSLLYSWGSYIFSYREKHIHTWLLRLRTFQNCACLRQNTVPVPFLSSSLFPLPINTTNNNKQPTIVFKWLTTYMWIAGLQTLQALSISDSCLRCRRQLWATHETTIRLSLHMFDTCIGKHKAHY